jgi:hypothetical protein
MTDYCWYSLDIDISNSLSVDWEFPIPSKPRQLWSYMPNKILNQSWVTMMKNNYNIDVIYVLLFYCDPYFSPNVAHIDIKSKTPDPCVCAMNWVIGGENSKMYWYNTPNDNKEIEFTGINTAYLSWHHDTLTECDSHTILDNLTLVRTDVPHRVESANNKRWCISIRIDESNLNDWDKVVDHMKSQNILISRN